MNIYQQISQQFSFIIHMVFYAEKRLYWNLIWLVNKICVNSLNRIGSQIFHEWITTPTKKIAIFIVKSPKNQNI